MPSTIRLTDMGLLPSGFWSAVDSFVEWAADLGLPGLAILSFTEAFFQPVPPEALTSVSYTHLTLPTILLV